MEFGRRSHSQQLLVEDTNDSGALQAVGGGAALALLEGVRKPLDVVPLAKILQRERERVVGACDWDQWPE